MRPIRGAETPFSIESAAVVNDESERSCAVTGKRGQPGLGGGGCAVGDCDAVNLGIGGRKVAEGEKGFLGD